MFLLEVFQTDGSTGCLWFRAVSRFSPLKIILNHSTTCPIYIEVQVACVQVYSTCVFDGDGLYVCMQYMPVFNDYIPAILVSSVIQHFYLCSA